jgi:DNA-binding MarR family transcriptional regulator
MEHWSHRNPTGDVRLMMSLEQDGPMTVNTLARHIGVDPSTVPRALIAFRRNRMVAVDVGKDRRQRVIAITATGRRRLAAALPRWEAVQRSILKSSATPPGTRSLQTCEKSGGP